MITGVDYHRRTSYRRGSIGGHFLDWANQPKVFKTFDGLDRIRLPKEVDYPRRNLTKILSATGGVPVSEEGIDKKRLALLLILTETLSGKARSAGSDFYLRSAASAGALYPTEIYAAVHAAADISPGIYHFNPFYHELTLLRAGDFREVLLNCTKMERKLSPVVTFFFTAIFFRSAWKYRDRSYRYHLLDTGHVEENLTLALRALQFSYEVRYDFDDNRLNRLLGLDETREAAVSIVFLKGSSSASGEGGGEIDRLPDSILNAGRVAETEIDYPLILRMHESGKQVISGDGSQMKDAAPFKVSPGRWKDVESFQEDAGGSLYPDCVFLRRSDRNFVREPVSEKHMSMFLRSLCFPGEPGCCKNLCSGFIVGNVRGMEPGIHVLDRENGKTALIFSGSYTEKMADVCLNQAWLAHAAAHFFFSADLEAVDAAYGSRGYRYSMLHAGRLGQRLYVASTAVGIGCCGIGAFYDSEAMELLGLNEGWRLLYLIAIGLVKNKKNY
jgi:SagB-type dehydrogenase family enzyme